MVPVEEEADHRPDGLIVDSRQHCRALQGCVILARRHRAPAHRNTLMVGEHAPRLPRCAQDRPGLRCGPLYQAGRSRRSRPASACTSSSGICHVRGRRTPGRQRYRARRHGRYSCRPRRNGRRAINHGAEQPATLTFRQLDGPVRLHDTSAVPNLQASGHDRIRQQ